MPKEYARTRRVSEQIRRELGELIQSRLADPRLELVSVTEVDLSPDMTNAKVFVSALNLDPADRSEINAAVSALNKASGYLRRALNGRLHMRGVPRLRFFADNSMAEGERLAGIIDAAVAEDASHHDPNGNGDAH